MFVIELLYYKHKVSDLVPKYAVITVVLLFLLYLYKRGYYEYFHFEVTPWKKTCLNDDPYRCPQCCSRGFRGQNVHFYREGDAAMLNCKENFCGSCNM